MVGAEAGDGAALAGSGAALAGDGAALAGAGTVAGIAVEALSALS